jgi:hypothetical protein
MMAINLISVSGKIGSGKDTVAQMIQELTTPQGSGRREDGIQRSTWQIKKFAYKLKQMVSLLTGIPVEYLEKEEVKNKELGIEWLVTRYSGKPPFETAVDETPMAVREMLQKLGTEGVRKRVHENAWVNALFVDYRGHMEKYHSGNWSDEGMYKHSKCPVCKESFHGYKRQTRCAQCIEKQGALYPNWLITDCRFLNEAQAVKDRGGIVLRIERPPYVVMNNHQSEMDLDHYEFDYIIYNDLDLDSLRQKVQVFLQHYKLI